MADPIPLPLAVPADYGLRPPSGDIAPWAESLHRIGAERNWWVATVRPDGRPHVVPVWGVVVGDDIYFSTDGRSTKGRNLASNSHIALHLESGDRVTIVEGTVTALRYAELPTGFDSAYTAKYYEIELDGPHSVFYRLDISHALVWLEDDFADTAVKWQFAQDESNMT